MTTLNANVRRVFELFARAKSAGLRWPKVRLEAGDGTKVVLSQAGERSRYTGQVMVTDGGPYGEGKYFGRIDQAGTLVAGRDMTGAVGALVDALAADPAGVAAIYGRRTGQCCFCGRGLEDGRSVAVGYGPVCAEKFGLPWGEERVAPVAVALGTGVAGVPFGVLDERAADIEEGRLMQAREAEEERRRMDRKFAHDAAHVDPRICTE